MSGAAARHPAAPNAFRDASVPTRHHQVGLQAPPAVREKSDRAYRPLRQWRDPLGTHPDPSLTSPEHLEGLERLDQARKDLGTAMRARLLTAGR
ncbi:hypothetical protein SUDANB176_03408 [Streptomyces sp. enrichment culture]|uniref:hypothetical protein n=1 Tax=Streptomyces sp. enrichment culture TaxID=1795815 RepID=UPI003F57E9FD